MEKIPKIASFRITAKSYKAVRKLAGIIGCSKSKVINNALKEYFYRRHKMEASLYQILNDRNDVDELKNILLDKGLEGFFQSLGVMTDYDIYLQNNDLLKSKMDVFSYEKGDKK